MKRTIVVIDTDAGADDLVALHYALLARTLHVHSVIGSYGNFPLSVTMSRLSALLHSCPDYSRPVLVSGSDAPLDHRYSPPAGIHDTPAKSITGNAPYSYAPAATLRSLTLPGKPFTYVALGPLTNLSKILSSRNAGYLKQIVLFGGAFGYPGNATPLSEANFYWDPEAVKVVLRSKIPTVIMPLNISETVQLTKRRIQTLHLPSYLKRIWDPYHTFYTKTKRFVSPSFSKPNIRFDGAVLHDILPIIYIVNKKTFRYKTMLLSLDLIDTHRGFVFPMLRGDHEMNANSSIPKKIAVSVNEHLLWNTLLGIYPSVNKKFYT